MAIYRNTGDESLKTQTRTAVDLLANYHRSLAGTIIADEYISDLNPSRGAELCIAAEVMFSSAYIYQYLGDNDIADWAEQIAFNAFPVSVAPDWWSHQYVQQENQVREVLASHRAERLMSFSPGLGTSQPTTCGPMSIRMPTFLVSSQITYVMQHSFFCLLTDHEPSRAAQ